MKVKPLHQGQCHLRCDIVGRISSEVGIAWVPVTIELFRLQSEYRSPSEIPGDRIGRLACLFPLTRSVFADSELAEQMAKERPQDFNTAYKDALAVSQQMKRALRIWREEGISAEPVFRIGSG